MVIRKYPSGLGFEEPVTALEKLSHHQTFLENLYQGVVINKKQEIKIETPLFTTHSEQIGSLKFSEILSSH